jgi:hypothetical protein
MNYQNRSNIIDTSARSQNHKIKIGHIPYDYIYKDGKTIRMCDMFITITVEVDFANGGDICRARLTIPWYTCQMDSITELYLGMKVIFQYMVSGEFCEFKCSIFNNQPTGNPISVYIDLQDDYFIADMWYCRFPSLFYELERAIYNWYDLNDQ